MLRVAQVQYFFRHDIYLPDVHTSEFSQFTFTFAFVKWFKKKKKTK
jgi:hypothetical protein